MAGTQGMRGHRKSDRLLELAGRMRLPTVFFTEGGGGRPGDTDLPIVSALDVGSFALWGGLQGVVPRIAVVSGRCFAGNAVLAGCADLRVATPDANLGMAGPAMIAGGGLGDFRPEEIGPVDEQAANGMLDVVAEDEAHAVDVVRRLLGYLAPAASERSAPRRRRRCATRCRTTTGRPSTSDRSSRPWSTTTAPPGCASGGRPSSSPPSPASTGSRSG